MHEKLITKHCDIIKKLIAKNESMRAFARSINHDSHEVSAWRDGKRLINAKGVVAVAKIYNIKPSDLRPDIFPDNLDFVFN